MMPIAIHRDMREGSVRYYFEELEAFVLPADAIERGLVTDDEQRQLDAEIASLGWGGADHE